jgi:uncharacterized protein (DUF924 family)
MDSILDFWFPDNNYQKWWFKSTPEMDRKIYDTYYDVMYKQYNNFNEADYNYAEPYVLISTIILFDQFSRNMARINMGINVNDFTRKARQLTNIWLKRALYKTEPIKYTVFAYMPIRHMKKGDEIEQLAILLERMEIQDSNLKTDTIFNKFKSTTIRNLQSIERE